MSTTYDTIIRPTCEPESETYYLNHDPDSSWEVTTSLVFAVSSLAGIEPTEMLPLNQAVDPDVLESHVRGRERGARLSFDFQGYHVTVADDGRVELTPINELEA